MASIGLFDPDLLLAPPKRREFGPDVQFRPPTAAGIGMPTAPRDAYPVDQAKGQSSAPGTFMKGLGELGKVANKEGWFGTPQATVQQPWQPVRPEQWTSGGGGQEGAPGGGGTPIEPVMKALPGPEPMPVGTGTPEPQPQQQSSNNPGGVTTAQGTRLASYPTRQAGVDAMLRNVRTYPELFNGGRPMTLEQIGSNWAPGPQPDQWNTRPRNPNDPMLRGNNPKQWAANVAAASGLPVNQPIDLNNPRVLAALGRGIEKAEKGVTANEDEYHAAAARILAAPTY